MCGENELLARDADVRKGSPPRMRGKRHHVGCVRPEHGIIPACAGKTSARTMLRTSCRDHPRVCGENCGDVTVSRRFLGSPPRVRGKHFAEKVIVDFVRITPACAGKARGVVCCPLRAQDHPRVYGESTRTVRSTTRN